MGPQESHGWHPIGPIWVLSDSVKEVSLQQVGSTLTDE